MVARQLVSSGSPFEPTIGFSRAIRVGNRVLVSGTGPVFPERRVPDRRRRPGPPLLRDRGARPARSRRIAGRRRAHAMYVTALEDADAVGAVHGELFGAIRPAATMVVVAGLLDPRWLVEVEAEAELSQ